jgi:hypothetical protein
VLIAGSGNYVDTYQSHGNGVNGFRVTGSSNTIYRGAGGDIGKGNGGDGFVLLDGSANTVREGTAYANGGHGIAATGTNHQLIKNIVGDKGKGNGGDGIRLAGTGVLVQETRARGNGGDGVNVSGGTLAGPNRLRGNESNTGASDSGTENTGQEYRLLGVVNHATGNKADGIGVPKTSKPQKCPTFPPNKATVDLGTPITCE